MNDNIGDYLKDSETFDEFYAKADTEIDEHLQEIKPDDIILENDIKDYAKELWDEYTMSTF